MVLNKIDRLEDNNVFSIKDIKNSLNISAKTGEGMDLLLEKIEESLPVKYKLVELLIPYDRQYLVDYFLENYDPDKVEYLNEGTSLVLSINEVDYQKYADLLVGN